MSEAPDRSRSWESTPAFRQLWAARGLRFHGRGFVRIVEMCGERTEHSSGRRRGFALGVGPAVVVSAALSTASFSAGNEGPLDRGQFYVYLLFGGVGVGCRARLRVGDNSESGRAPARCLTIRRDRGLVRRPWVALVLLLALGGGGHESVVEVRRALRFLAL
jgi:hypothetical protein